MNRIKGSQRSIADAVRALAALARARVAGLESSKKLLNCAGPPLSVNAYTMAPSNSTVHSVQIRLKSSSDASQRARIQREASSATAITALTTRKSACQPQKRSPAPSRSGGVFMVGSAFK